MIFCSECFVDPEIKSIIKNCGHISTCPVCGKSNVNIYDTDIDYALYGKFDDLLSTYTTEDYLPADFPNFEKKFLIDIIINDWDIFSNIDNNNVLKIVESISKSLLSDYPELFTKPVGIKEKYDKDYIEKHSILKTENWDEFVESIKHNNRFHNQLINLDLLKDYCFAISEEIHPSEKRYYRGRIANNAEGFKPSEMGAPPKEKATDGRANAAGVPRLYLTNDKETTLHEIRAAEYDYVTIATFKPKSKLNIVNLSKISNISPFSGDVECTALAINKDTLSKINEEMSKTMRRGDSFLDYLPTQYISDFIMSILDEDGNPLYDGIIYKSAMNSKGYNLAIFDPDKFKCTYCKTYEIVELKYKRIPLKIQS